jgi:hypothetical protein
MAYCASLKRAVNFVYGPADAEKTQKLKRDDIIKIYGVNGYGASARARTTADGCQDGIIYDADFYIKLPDCSTFTC